MVSTSSSATTRAANLACAGLAACVLLASANALAEEKPQQQPSDHKQLYKYLYTIYDTNMDEYDNKKNNHKARQGSYVQAEAALSDFRKQGCKTKDVKCGARPGSTIIPLR